MARMAVFVDDAVQGRFPPVCARTGAPADRLARLDQRIGNGGGWAVLLLLLGPIGWIVFAVLAFGGETLTVRVPVAAGVAERWTRQRRIRLLGWAIVAAGLAAVWFAPGPRPDQGFGFGPEGGFGLVLAGFAVVAVTSWRLWSDSIGVDLDASRRWVTLTGVSQAFADAVAAWAHGERAVGGPHGRPPDDR